MTRLALTLSAASAALALSACDASRPGSEDEETSQAETGAEGAQTDAELDPAQSATGAALPDPVEEAAPPAVDPEIAAIVDEARACENGGAFEFEAPEMTADETEEAHNLMETEAVLDAAATADCFYQLPSGLYFRVDRPVEDAPSPITGQMVEVHYEGRLPDGTVFDSTYERGEPAVFPSDRLIQGWVQTLPLMNVGEAWTLVIPPELAYGEQGTPGGPIAPNETLIFELELLGIPGRELGAGAPQ